MNRLSYKPVHGAVMLEFAIVLPVLLFVTFGITELGRALYQENMLTKSAIAGARFMARGYEAVVEQTGSCDRGASWDSLSALATNIVIYGKETPQSETDQPLLENMTVSIDMDPEPKTSGSGDGAVSSCVIKVTATADFVSLFGDLLIPGLGLVSDMEVSSNLLNVSIEERYLGE